ncbi:toxin-antitoxin system YwqK family antitoxin [Rufibacter roseus]|uniref:Toxin-antitoxin system YwqK family antitoxin n=1 Tax=Rufibacter roseus TaxID=1567108 RepID=A0ABW2DT71_9BACT|nr:hypothetical protein [Rufibacter roseus]
MKASSYSAVALGFKATAVCLLLLLGNLEAHAIVWPWSWNKVDKNELRHGKWRTFQHDNPEVLQVKGRYKHGKEWGRWKTYSPEGKLYFKEKFKPKKKEVITTYYHPNGKVSHKGVAYQFEGNKGIWNYYWDGEWKFYDENGNYIGSKTYVKGTATSEKPIMPEEKTTSARK